MAGPLLVDRVKQTTTTTGTGTVNLDASVPTGFQSFVSGIGNGNTCFYCIAHDTLDEWEIGVGTVTDATPDTLSRTTILTGTNSTSAVNFSAGNKTVFCVAPGTYGFPYIRDVTSFSVYSSNQTLGGQTAGNARGNYAVDLQLARDNANRVASGAYSVISGGNSNRVVADNSVVSGGELNWITTASTNYQVIGGGITNLISSTGSTNTIAGGGTNTISGGSLNTIVGGDTNTISSAFDANFIGGGSDNTISSGSDCVIFGGNNNQILSGVAAAVAGGSGNSVNASYALAFGRQSLSAKYGGMVHSAGQLAAQGDAQTGQYVARGTTTDATSTEIFLDGSSARLEIPNDSTWLYEVNIVARRSDADNVSAGYRLTGIIDNNANTVAVVGTQAVLLNQEDNASYGVVISADNTNKSLKIAVQGVAGHTVKWVAFIRTVEVTG